MNPVIHLFNDHITGMAFKIGVHKGLWGVVSDDPLRPGWPLVYIWVAAPLKQRCPDKYYFKFDLTGYPKAPTACPWDIEKNERLAFNKWPTGGVLVTSVFRAGWNAGNSLYAPCDRNADLAGHANWAQQHPAYYWKEGFTIVKYMQFLSEIFYSGDYEHT